MCRAALATNLQIEHEWREALQSQIAKHEEEKSKHLQQLKELSIVKEQLEETRKERNQLQQQVMEQEQTIGDLAGNLGE